MVNSKLFYTGPGVTNPDATTDKEPSGGTPVSAGIKKMSFDNWIKAEDNQISISLLVFSIMWYFISPLITDWLTPGEKTLWSVLVPIVIYVLFLMTISFSLFEKTNKGKKGNAVICMAIIMTLLQLTPLVTAPTKPNESVSQNHEARVIESDRKIQFVNMNGSDCKNITIRLKPGEEKKITSTVFIEILTFSEDIYFQKKEGDKQWIKVGVSDSFTLPRDSRPTCLKGGPNGSKIDVIGKSI